MPYTPKSNEYKCKRCAHVWTRRAKHTIQCPNCRSRQWNTKPPNALPRRPGHEDRMPITGYALTYETDLPGSEPEIIGEYATLELARDAAAVYGAKPRVRTMRGGYLDEVCCVD